MSEAVDPATYARAWERATALLKRRQAASSLGLGVNTALLAAISFIARSDTLTPVFRGLAAALLMIAGIAACDLWRRSLLDYQRLMAWWYDRLRVLEEAMPRTDRLASAEYEALYAPGSAKVGLTRHELRLIVVLSSLHVAFTALTFGAAALGEGG